MNQIRIHFIAFVLIIVAFAAVAIVSIQSWKSVQYAFSDLNATSIPILMRASQISLDISQARTEFFRFINKYEPSPYLIQKRIEQIQGNLAWIGQKSIPPKSRELIDALQDNTERFQSLLKLMEFHMSRQHSIDALLTSNTLTSAGATLSSLSGKLQDDLWNFVINENEASHQNILQNNAMLSGISTIIIMILICGVLAQNRVLQGQVEQRTVELQDRLHDLHQSREALRESEKRFRLAYQTSPDSINLNRLDDGAYIDVNDGFTRIMGYSNEDVIGKTSLELNIWQRDEDRKRLVHGLSQNGYVENLEAQFVGKDGVIRHGLMSAAILKIDGEDVIISTTRDISRFKQAEKAVWESTERFQKVFNSQQDAIFVLDAQIPSRVLECNQAASNIFGYEAHEMIGGTLEKLHIDKSHQKKFQQFLLSAIQTNGKLIDFEFSMMRKGGNVFPSEHSVFELKNDAGARSGWVSVIRDLTERKQIETRLRQAQKMETIGNLAGGIAHDFNNILFPIIGMSELLLEDLTPGSLQHANAHEILKAGKRGSDLVRQILAFGRQSDINLMPVRLQQILRDVLKLSRATIPSNIDIIQDIQSDCGMVLADPTQLHQIAMNLITNAYHAVEQTGGSISIELKAGVNDSGKLPANLPQTAHYALLTIKDSGCGIDPAIMGNIFDPYFTTKKKGKGTGLGLAVVYGIVRELNGDIEVSSRAGDTRFHVYLPLIDHKESPVSDQSPNIPRCGNERILVVDDEVAIVGLEKQMLERHGFHVTMQTSSVNALRLFADDPHAFDLVITDMSMPQMTGDRLAKELITIRPDIPIIICTGFSERIDHEKAQAVGISGFLMKPIVKDELLEMIGVLLDAGKPQSKAHDA